MVSTKIYWNCITCPITTSVYSGGLASINASNHICPFQKNTVSPSHSPHSPITHSTQKAVSHTIDLHTLQKLATSTTEVREKARLNSLGLPRVGDWLNTVPCKALGLHLRSLEFVTMTRYRLGLPVFQVEGQCPAECGLTNDRLGDHALGCAHRGKRLNRHNALRDIIFETAQQSLLSPTMEERSLIPNRES